MPEREHPIIAALELLAMHGVNPNLFQLDYRTEDNSARVAVGIPKTKTGIALLGDRIDALEEEDWYITSLTNSDLEGFVKVFDAISTLYFEHARRKSQGEQVKKGSKEEEALLAAILQANLPEPDRNYRVYRENGNELTTPDFTWESLKVAFYMDGLWWHQTKDDAQMLNMLAEAGKDKDKGNLLKNQQRTRAQRDADNRSELASKGWQILTCTDADLTTEKDIQKQVKRIGQTLRQAAEIQKLRAQQNKHSDKGEAETDFNPFASL